MMHGVYTTVEKFKNSNRSPTHFLHVIFCICQAHYTPRERRGLRSRRIRVRVFIIIVGRGLESLDDAQKPPRSFVRKIGAQRN